jgi:rhodanese-related sulfurtransferase
MSSSARRKEGTLVFYRLASDKVARVFAAVRDVANEHLAETGRAAREFLGEDGVEAIDRADLLDRVRTDRYMLLDVRPRTEFESGHIDGAVSVPLDELADLPRDLEVVAYCRGQYCVLSYDAVRLLRAKGRPARRLDGGMLEWMLERRPVAAGG